MKAPFPSTSLPTDPAPDDAVDTSGTRPPRQPESQHGAVCFVTAAAGPGRRLLAPCCGSVTWVLVPRPQDLFDAQALLLVSQRAR